MCGIAGLAGDFPQPENLLQKMKFSTKHRGPDQDGVFIDYANKIFLGHQRLSIIDCSINGKQPMRKGPAVIVFNGEIYNYKDLYKELQNDFDFSSASDTEVLLAGYLKYGINQLLEKITGMFAFCIYDDRKKLLFLVRDRLGEKPLYYYSSQGKFAFASELKSFRHLSEAQEIDFTNLDHYLTLGYVPAPLSIIKNVKKLQPGCLLTVDLSNFHCQMEKYWDLDPTINKQSLSEQDAIDKITELLKKSVSQSLNSDVPLGIFLSGGIDSSLIACLAKNILGNKTKTFSVIYDNKSFDESQYSRQMAKYLGIEHMELPINSNDAKNAIMDFSSFIDEPLADMSIIPTYLLSKLTRKHVTVALGGDGADEMFIGYPTHLAHKLVNVYNLIPESLRKNFIEKLISHLPISHKDFSIEFKLKRFIGSANLEPQLRHFCWQSQFNYNEKKLLYNREFNAEQNLTDFLHHHIPTDIISIFNLIEYLDLKFYLPNDILAKVDIASMANSLEVRAPYLNHHLVEFVYSLDEKLKLKLFRQKYILKKVAAKFLPANIVYRKKHGFGIPLGQWLKEDLSEYAAEILSRQNVEKIPVLNFQYINKLFNEHKNGAKDNRKQLWALITLLNWHQSYYGT